MSNLTCYLGYLAFAVLASACGQATTGPLTTTCQLPSDQTQTLEGKWTVTPIPIAFHQGDWAASELSAMTAAATTWNTFFSEVQDYSIIDFGGNTSSPRLSTQAKPTNPCDYVMLNGATYSAPAVVYKDTTWPYGTSTIALTRYCTSNNGSGATAKMTGAYIEVNYQDYFTTNLVPDLQSIVLHEMGHLAGLAHSCESTTTTGFPNCSTNATYSDAVMAPVFTFNSNGAGQLKQGLTANDEGRVNCLYAPSTHTSTTN